MRRALFWGICLLVFLAACTVQQSQEYDRFESVKLYTAMSGGSVTHKDVLLEGDIAVEFRELAQAECQQAQIPEEFRRVTLEGKGSSLVLYMDVLRETLFCSVLKPAQNTPEYLPVSDAPSEDIVMVVNGESISSQQVQAALAVLPEGVQQDAATIDQVLNQLLNDALLQQEARDVQVSEEDVAAARTVLLERAGLTEESLQQRYEDGSLSEEEFSAVIQEQARLQRLFKDRLLVDEIEVRDSDLQQFYLDNPNQFLQSETAIMRQILISAQGRSQEQLQERSRMVANFLQEGDFCEGVERFSDVEGGQCGIVFVPRGVANPELEYAAFNTQENRTAVVVTESGVHFIQSLQQIPAQVVPYGQVAENLRSQAMNSELQQRLSMYLSMLRGSATVSVYRE